MTDACLRAPPVPRPRAGGARNGSPTTCAVTRSEREAARPWSTVNGASPTTELWIEARRVAARFARSAWRPGDVVSSQLPNGWECVVVHLAAELAGAIHNPLAIQFREHEIDQVTNLLDSRLVINPGVFRGTDFAAIHAATTGGRRQITVDELFAGRRTAALGRLAARSRRRGLHSQHLRDGRDQGCRRTRTRKRSTASRTVAEMMRFGPSDTMVCAIPMSWGGGLCWGVRFALHTGACLVSMERWDPELAANLLDREGGTFIYGPPTLARDLVDLADTWRPANPLRMICAGAPIPRQMCVDARDRLGLELVPGYGQTEHLHSVLGRLDDPIERADVDRRPRPARRRARRGRRRRRRVRAGRDRRAECRGPNVSLGYWNQPDLTKETYRSDGWQMTRDAGWFDADGSLHVVGRLRDLIIRGGLNVSPREVEELLLRHPDVGDVAVVGEPDERYGERICAFVVPKGSAAPTSRTSSSRSPRPAWRSTSTRSE